MESLMAPLDFTLKDQSQGYSKFKALCLEKEAS